MNDTLGSYVTNGYKRGVSARYIFERYGKWHNGDREQRVSDVFYSESVFSIISVNSLSLQLTCSTKFSDVLMFLLPLIVSAIK